ncbi:MAG: aspartate 1-decarboxylase [Acidobacteria bacterium]|nr:MAG: aspartate 1-decarboxylase [Acidobacteriota bacterium]PYX59616.1 MAG: aspartate 1-decarboxylase [Acidobacteriota bacterium]PYX62933.1 MAG: aspartate 1-decarboxylase [Acidobacteriota bacterium]
MLLKLMKSKIHRATVTRADLNYEGSIGIDENLLESAGILAGESVHVWNINNGQRCETYALPSTRGSGEICLNGAAARLVQAGDLVIVTTFCWLEEEAARRHVCRVVLVDEKNRALK